MRSKKLDNIQLFNDVYYKTCLFNPLFTAIQSLNKNIFPLLSNDIFIYDFDKDAERMNLYVRCVNSKHWKQLLTEMGIGSENHIPKDIIKDLKESILNERFVIIQIDNYYFPFTTGTYQVGHSLHNILVYGFDDALQVFDIVDIQTNSNGCYKAQVSYANVSAGYDEIKINPIFKNNTYLYLELYKLANDSFYNKGYYKVSKEVFIRNMLNNREQIYLGIDRLNKSIDDYSNSMINEDVFFNSVQKLPDYGHLYLYIKTFKHAENYRNIQFLGYQEGITDKMEVIINNWVFIRGVITKFITSKKFNNDSKNKVLKKMNEIYQAELEYNNNLFRLLEKEGTYNV